MSMSSRTILFETDSELSADCLVDMAVLWPVSLQGNVRLKLHIHGSVVWASGARAVIRILRYEFRTRGPRAVAASAKRQEPAPVAARFPQGNRLPGAPPARRVWS